MKTAAMNTIELADVKLAVAERGAGAPLLLVHGFPLDHSMWRGQLDGLADEFRLIAPDLRGFGASGLGEAAVSMERYADDLAELLDALAIDEPVHFCGLSMGGYVAWQFCKRHKARLASLILCDTRAVADSAEAAQNREAMAERVLNEGASVVAEAMAPKLFAESTAKEQPEIVAATRKVMESSSPQGVAAALRAMARREDFTAALNGIETRSLVICGRHDQISTVDEMTGIAGALPNAELLIVEEAGHMAPLEQPQAVNDAIRAFLKST